VAFQYLGYIVAAAAAAAVEIAGGGSMTRCAMCRRQILALLPVLLLANRSLRSALGPPCGRVNWISLAMTLHYWKAAAAAAARRTTLDGRATTW